MLGGDDRRLSATGRSSAGAGPPRRSLDDAAVPPLNRMALGAWRTSPAPEQLRPGSDRGNAVPATHRSARTQPGGHRTEPASLRHERRRPAAARSGTRAVGSSPDDRHPYTDEQRHALRHPCGPSLCTGGLTPAASHRSRRHAAHLLRAARRLDGFRTVARVTPARWAAEQVASLSAEVRPLACVLSVSMRRALDTHRTTPVAKP